MQKEPLPPKKEEDVVFAIERQIVDKETFILTYGVVLKPSKVGH